MKNFTITGDAITVDDCYAIVESGAQIALSPEAEERIKRCRATIEKLMAENRTIYGVNTGFGKLSNTRIKNDEAESLQQNIVISHACGVGKPLPSNVVRMVMFITMLRFAKGHSGIRLETVNTLIEMLNKGVIPVVPEKGSLGASGDLVPLAHIALVLIGFGEAMYKGEVMSGAEAMKIAGIKPVVLGYKEGLALLNGTQVMNALGIFAIMESFKLFKTANISTALMMEAVKGCMPAFDERIHAIRPHKGQMAVAKEVKSLLDGSGNVGKSENIQNPYSLRCVPQVHGATLDALHYVKSVLETELNSVTDNPLIFPDDEDVLSGGNFHGQPLALALDFLAIAISELANISERRIEQLVNPQLSGLAPFLINNSGLNSGMMIAQYTAASLVSENKIYASPASVDSIPSSANQEDHVSMGSISARKLDGIVENVRNVLAIELMCAAQAIDLSDAVEGLSPMTAKVYKAIRQRVPILEKDRTLYTDINQIAGMIRCGEL